MGAIFAVCHDGCMRHRGVAHAAAAEHPGRFHRLCVPRNKPGGLAPQTAALTESQAEALAALLRAAELRQTVPQESYAVGDTVYDCVLSIRPDPFYETKIRLFRLDGRVHSYVDALNGRFYRILDPEPLLVFFENEIAFKS